MFSEDQLLPLSALQHLLFCERQCALIHVEGLWVENRPTTEGRHLHEKVHQGPGQSRAGLRIARGLPLQSLRLGLAGKADVVEFHPVDDAHGWRAPPRPFPVEYKRGQPKRNDCDKVQLCAQAMCLEEMLGVQTPSGALFYGRTRRRLDVTFDPQLRRRTERAAERLHDLVARGRTPPARREPKCKNCSLLEICLPDATDNTRSAERYLRNLLRSTRAGVEPHLEPPP
jgi:CRISPR-associated exonuclease Cas4